MLARLGVIKVKAQSQQGGGESYLVSDRWGADNGGNIFKTVQSLEPVWLLGGGRETGQNQTGNKTLDRTADMHIHAYNEENE